MDYRQALAEGQARLAAAGMNEAPLDARLLMQHAAGFDHTALISRMHEAMPADLPAVYEELIARRLAGEPVSRIIGRREFYGLEFAVTPAVLDPRPETETLVDRVLDDWRGVAGQNAGPLRFADIGTGSGAIAVALLTHLPASRCVASDISPDALAIAAANARAHGVAGRIELVHADFAEGLVGPFDFVVSNPPYIASGDIGGLSREVKAHDPVLALDGGGDGFDAFRALFATVGDLLKPGGRLYMEMGAGQEEGLRELAAASDWDVIEVIADMAGIGRVAVARLRQYASQLQSASLQKTLGITEGKR